MASRIAYSYRRYVLAVPFAGLAVAGLTVAIIVPLVGGSYCH